MQKNIALQSHMLTAKAQTNLPSAQCKILCMYPVDAADTNLTLESQTGFGLGCTQKPLAVF